MIRNTEKKTIYLDNAATTKPDMQCASIIEECLNTYWANPSSTHSLGKLANNHISDLANKMMKKCKLDKGNIYFFPSATLANNVVIQGHCEKYKKPKIVCGNFEHPSVLETVLKQGNAEKIILDLSQLYFFIKNNKASNEIKNYIIDAYLTKIDSSVSFVSIIWINNENGLILPIFEIAKEIKRLDNSIHIHIDAVQGFMKFPIPDTLFTVIDSFSVSSHKFHSIKGAGFLWLKDDKSIMPIIHGGGQQNGFFPSTENTLSILAMLEIINSNYDFIEKRLQHVEELMHLLHSSLFDSGNEKLFVLRNKYLFSNYIMKIYTDQLPSEPILNLLNDHGICVSYGSACSSKIAKRYSDTQKFGIPDSFQKGGIRISLSYKNSLDDISYFVKTYTTILNQHSFK